MDVSAVCLAIASIEAQAATAGGSVWRVLGCVAGAGAVGGIVNAFLSGNVRTPRTPRKEHGILQPKILGHIFLGAFAAVTTWGLYGPLKDAVIVGTAPTGQVSATLTVTSLVGAALAGSGGSRVVTSEIDKRFLRTAAINAANKDKNPKLAAMLATASPLEAADAATSAP